MSLIYRQEEGRSKKLKANVITYHKGSCLEYYSLKFSSICRRYIFGDEGAADGGIIYVSIAISECKLLSVSFKISKKKDFVVLNSQLSC